MPSIPLSRASNAITCKAQPQKRDYSATVILLTALPRNEAAAHCFGRERKPRPTYPPKLNIREMERRWLSLARSYEFSERLASFTNEVKRNIRKNMMPI